MLRNLIVCGFALACLLLLTADASACGKRRGHCSSGCYSSCHYAPAAPVYHQPPPPPPPPAPVYYQPVSYCSSSCGDAYSGGCCGHGHRGHGHRRCH